MRRGGCSARAHRRPGRHAVELDKKFPVRSQTAMQPGARLPSACAQGSNGHQSPPDRPLGFAPEGEGIATSMWRGRSPAIRVELELILSIRPRRRRCDMLPVAASPLAVGHMRASFVGHRERVADWRGWRLPHWPARTHARTAHPGQRQTLRQDRVDRGRCSARRRRTAGAKRGGKLKRSGHTLRREVGELSANLA